MEHKIMLLRELISTVLIFIITKNIIIHLLTSSKGSTIRGRKLPPGPKGWPVVGALPLLGAMPHVALANMAKKYGHVMYLKVGTCGMAVASSPEAAEAFLKTLDINFVNRPPNAGATLLAYNAQDLVFAEYGPRWKLLRKLSNLHMLGGKALDEWTDIRANELGHMLLAMQDLSQRGKPVVVADMLVHSMANMMGRVILSRRVFDSIGSESTEFKEMVVELMTTAGYFNIGDFIPSIAWMDLQGIERGMKRLHKRFDKLLTRMIEEHERSANQRKVKSDLLDFVLENRDNPEGERLSTENIKALLLNLFTAGVDTSSSAIEWGLAEMINKPSILKKAHEEMDRVIGRDRRLVESDIPKLPYFRAICKEAFRKHPSTPLNLPRISTQACEIDGYYIPKNTRLSVNIWAIGRDPDVWENPMDFNPERFLGGPNAKIEPQGNDFKLIPFGAGRRICAGYRMGIVMVEYILGSLVHSFDWKLPADVIELNMDEVFGLALQKAVPLQAMVSPRLSLNAYDA